MRSGIRILTVALLAAACRDNDQPLGPRGAQQTTTPGSIESKVTKRYGVALSAVGPFVTGQAVRLTAQVIGLSAPGPSTVQIVLPELEVGKLTGWKLGAPTPVGISLPAAASWHTQIALGSQSFDASVTFPVEGYYRAVASIVADTALETDPATGQIIDGYAQAEIWLLVTSTGGQATAIFDPLLLPDSAFPDPGPFRPSHGVSSRQDDQGPVSRAAPLDTELPAVRHGFAASSAAPVTIRHLWFNSTPGVNTYGVVPWARVHYKYTGGSSGIWQTSQFGEYTMTCPNSVGKSLALAHRAYNDTVQVRRNFLTGSAPKDTMVTFTIGTSVMCGSTIEIHSTNDTMPLLWDNMVSGIAGSRQFFGRGRRQLPVILTPPVVNQVPVYSAIDDWVQFPGNAVHGPYGQDVAPHEYGHALHFAQLGYNLSRWSALCPPTGHGQKVYTNLACAFTEGFAEYHAVKSRMDLYPWYANPGNLWDRMEHDLDYPAYNGSTDGSAIEGAVAATLLDLTDANNGSIADDDALTMPGSYILDILGTCQTQTSGTWSYPSGIDHLIYCMEKQIDPLVTGSPTYFPTRSPDPTAYTEAATEPGTWNRATIRQLWLRNLYGQ